MNSKIINTLLILISIISIGYIQSHFQKITEWDNNHIEIKQLNNDSLLVNNLFTFGNDGFYITLMEHKLGLDIVASKETGINKWLEQPDTYNYIEDFLKYYGYRGNIYISIFDNIVNDLSVNPKNKKIYKDLAYKYIKKELSEKGNKNFTDLYNFTAPLFCDQDDKLPLNKNLEKFYRINGLNAFEHKNYKEAGCLMLHSGYSAKLNLWKGILLLSYEKYLEKNLTDKEFIDNYEKNKKIIYDMSIKLKRIAILEKIQDIHRNTTKKDNLILINQQYLNAQNSLTQKYLDIKNK